MDTLKVFGRFYGDGAVAVCSQYIPYILPTKIIQTPLMSEQQ